MHDLGGGDPDGREKMGRLPDLDLYDPPTRTATCWPWLRKEYFECRVGPVRAYPGAEFQEWTLRTATRLGRRAAGTAGPPKWSHEGGR